jgi:hypothetical protein
MGTEIRRAMRRVWMAGLAPELKASARCIESEVLTHGLVCATMALWHYYIYEALNKIKLLIQGEAV